MSSKSPASFKGKVATSSEPARLSLANPELSDRAKKRVRDIDPNGNKCLVENCSEERAVDFAHVYSKWLANLKGEVDRIEWYWNMPRQTLNLDTRWNIIRLSSSIHRLFDNFLWVLAPEENIVDRYHKELFLVGNRYLTRRERFPDIKNRNDFRYKLIPINHDAMCKVALLRQNDPRPLPQPLTSDDFVIHTYPFDTMPVLKSHVHPKFVILKAGIAIFEASLVNLQGVDLLFAKYPILAKMNDIYQAWIASLPNNWMEDRTYNLPSPDPGKSEADSEYTERARTKPQKRRRHQDVPETPTPAAQTQRASASGTQGKWRVSKSVTSVCLSKKTLKLHDSTVGMGNWSNEAVQKWSAQCRPLPDTPHIS